MKIAIIGSGATGSVFGSFLRAGGADVTLVDLYKEHMDKVAKEGMIFHLEGKGTQTVTGFKTAYNADSIGIMDVVIFLTKATQVESALKSAAPCIGPNTVLMSLMNGLGNEIKLNKVVSADKIIYGSGRVATVLDGPGECTGRPSSGGTDVQFGPLEMSPLTDKVCKYLAECFDRGGCPSKYWEDIKPALWGKIVSNSTFNCLSAILRLKVGILVTDEYALKLVRMLINECCEVATADGCPMDPEKYMKERVDTIIGAPIADCYPSMGQDVLVFRRATEISTLNGAVAEYGRKYGIPTPVNDVVTLMISAIQNNYDKQYRDK